MMYYTPDQIWDELTIAHFRVIASFRLDGHPIALQISRKVWNFYHPDGIPTSSGFRLTSPWSHDDDGRATYICFAERSGMLFCYLCSATTAEFRCTVPTTPIASAKFVEVGTAHLSEDMAERYRQKCLQAIQLLR